MSQVDQLAQQILDMQAQMAFMMTAMQQMGDRATIAEAALAASVPVGSQPTAATAARPPSADLVDTRLLTKPKASEVKKQSGPGGASRCSRTSEPWTAIC